MRNSCGVGPGVNPDGTIPDDIADPLGSLDETSQLANSFGFAGQAVNKDYIAGYKNQFLIGASYDRGNVGYGATSTLGSFDPKFVVNSLGILLVAARRGVAARPDDDQRLLRRLLLRHGRPDERARADRRRPL